MNKYLKKAYTRCVDGFASNIGQGLAFDLFKRLAMRFNIESVTFNGLAGKITGTPYERVMATYIYTHSFSSEIIDLITNQLLDNRSGTIIDIGANIGLVTVPVASQSKAVIHSFEPEPRNFRYLKTNVEQNLGHGRVNLHNIALVAEEGMLKFELSNDNFGDHRIRRESKIPKEKFNEANREVINVEGRKLDEVLDAGTLPKPVVVKIDTQGAEVEVIKGGKNVFLHADYVLSEYCPYMLLRAGSDPDEFLEFVRGFPYAMILNESDYSGLQLQPTKLIIERMLDIPKDGSTARQLDILLARKNK